MKFYSDYSMYTSIIIDFSTIRENKENSHFFKVLLPLISEHSPNVFIFYNEIDQYFIDLFSMYQKTNTNYFINDTSVKIDSLIQEHVLVFSTKDNLNKYQEIDAVFLFPEFEKVFYSSKTTDTSSQSNPKNSSQSILRVIFLFSKYLNSKLLSEIRLEIKNVDLEIETYIYDDVRRVLESIQDYKEPNDYTDQKPVDSVISGLRDLLDLVKSKNPPLNKEIPIEIVMIQGSLGQDLLDAVNALEPLIKMNRIRLKVFNFGQNIFSPNFDFENIFVSSVNELIERL